ncbi:MAG TPA: hypothetical protein VL522_12160 [Bordetella sp.]|nr:hypothetical protein [Bordetella sp.]
MDEFLTSPDATASESGPADSTRGASTYESASATVSTYGSNDTSVTAIFFKKGYNPLPLASDGKEKYAIAVSAEYTGSSDIAEGVTLELSISGGDASKLFFWWDQACVAAVPKDPATGKYTITIGQDIPGVAGPGWQMISIYMTCTARADCKYTVMATPQWPEYQLAGGTWSFSAPVAMAPRNFIIIPVNGGTAITTLATPALTTPLVVQLLDTTNKNQPLANAQISGKLFKRNTMISAGTVSPDSPTTDGQGFITLSVFANSSTNATLELTDDISGGQGQTSVTTCLLLSISINAQPEPITQPGKVTFTAAITNDQGQYDPDNLKLKWDAGDQFSRKYFVGSQELTTRHNDPSTFQYTTAVAVTQSDLEHNPFGELAGELLVYGTDTPFRLRHEVPFDPAPSMLGPPAPIPLLAYIITDDVIAASVTEGIPFQIKGLADPPVDGSGLIFLWGHVIEGPLQPGPQGKDILVQSQHIKNNQAFVMYAPVNNKIFSKNGSVDLYYELTGWGNTSLSQVLTLIVDRDSLKGGPPVSKDLTPPEPFTYFYNKSDHDSKDALTLTVNFGGKQKAFAGDRIVVHLDLTGIASNNMNRFIPKTLPPYTLTQRYLQSQNADDVLVHFDGINGNPPGFPSTEFDGMSLFEAELYFEYLPAKTGGATLRSPSALMQIDTLLNGTTQFTKMVNRMARRFMAAQLTNQSE